MPKKAWGDDFMKTRAALRVMVAAMLVAFAAIVSQKAIADGDRHGMPSGAGKFSTTAQGSFALCLDPKTFDEESCSTEGVLVAPLSLLDNGALTADTQGNSCSSFTEVDSDLPVDATPPFVTPNA